MKLKYIYPKLKKIEKLKNIIDDNQGFFTHLAIFSGKVAKLVKFTLEKKKKPKKFILKSNLPKTHRYYNTYRSKLANF
jgi:hypothetical protein